MASNRSGATKCRSQHGIRPHDSAKARPRPSRFWVWTPLLVQDHRAAIMCVTALLIACSWHVPDQPHVRVQRGRGGAAFAFLGASPVAGALPAPAPRGRDRHGRVRPAVLLPAPNRIDLSRIEGQVRESSVKKIGEVVNAILKKPCDHPYLAASTGISMAKSTKTRPQGRYPLAYRARRRRPHAVLGEEHSAKIWSLMDEEEVKEVSQVCRIWARSLECDRKTSGRVVSRCRAQAR